jgi:hypothetical protein
MIQQQLLLWQSQAGDAHELMCEAVLQPAHDCRMPLHISLHVRTLLLQFRA